MMNVGFINKAAEIKPFIIEIEIQTTESYTLGLFYDKGKDCPESE